jgi:WD40 repeat protein
MKAFFRIALLATVGLTACGGCQPKRAPVEIKPKPLVAQPRPASAEPAAAEPETPLPPEPIWAGQQAQGDKAVEPKAADATAKEAAPRYTWKEVEDLLADLREKSKTDYSARQTLYEWYSRLESPAFTESKDYEQHLERLATWQEELPESTTPLVVMGGAYIHYAWEARGGAVAPLVTEDGWRLFKERIPKAHALLDKAVERGVKDGHAYASLIIVAKAEGMPVEETRELLAEGHKLDPTYLPMYSLMSDYLLPKWHGKPGDVAAFAKEVVEMLPGDDGLEAFAWIILNSHSSDRTILYWRGIDAKTLSGAAKVLFERYPNGSGSANYAALMAMAGGDHELGLTVLEEMEKQKFSSDLLVWGPEGFSHFKTWCRASTHPSGETYRLWGSLDEVRTFAFSEDPRYVWIAPQDASTSVLLVDTHTGEGRVPLRVPGVGIGKLAFDPAQKLLAASAVGLGFQCAIVWRMTDLERPQVIPLEQPCYSITISPVAPLLAAHDGTTVRVIDIEKRELKHLLEMPDKYVNALLFSPDGKLLASWARNEVSVWDVETGDKRYSIGTPDADRRPDIAMDEPFLFDSENRLVARYNSKAERGLGRFTEGMAKPEVLLPNVRSGFDTLSPDGKYFASVAYGKGQEWKINVWDVESKSVVQVVDGHAVAISKMDFSPDSKLLATGSKNGELKIWKINPAEKLE